MKRLLFFSVILAFVANAGELPVTIKGMDDGERTNRQQDYEEALLNAKLQAIQQSGLEISALTTIENFQMKHDLVESKSEGILLPGFQIIDIGYQTDGTYLIILSGKIKTAGRAGEDPSELYNKALLLFRQEKLEESLALLNTIITQYEGSEYAVKAYESRAEIEQVLSGSRLYDKAIMLMNQEKFGESLALLDTIIAQHEESEYAVKAYESKAEIAGVIGYYKQIAKKRIPENVTLDESASFKLLDRTGQAHELEVNLYYLWKTMGTSVLSTTELDCEFDYSFAIFLDGKLIDKKTAKGRVNKDGHPKLEVFDEGTGLTITVEQRKYWNVIEIWGGLKP